MSNNVLDFPAPRSLPLDEDPYQWSDEEWNGSLRIARKEIMDDLAAGRIVMTGDLRKALDELEAELKL
jgi:hypothetical protein